MHMEALPRRRSKREADALYFSGVLMEEPVAATVLLNDGGGAACLGLLRCVNDQESLERFGSELAEALWELGCRRVLGPTGLSPRLESGVLHSYFGETPPLHTAYNPPYLPELVESIWEPVATTQLFHTLIPPELPAMNRQPAQIVPLKLARLAGDLLPLFQVACPQVDELAPTTVEEVNFLLHWLQNWPLYGWLAQVGEQPVGFILLQPDLAPALKRAHGGRNLAWRLWLNWRSRRPVRAGRLLFGAVLPEWRRRGIANQLWRQALYTAQRQGWRSLTVGPVELDTPAAHFLIHMGTKAQQRYVIYGGDL